MIMRRSAAAAVACLARIISEDVHVVDLNGEKSPLVLKFVLTCLAMFTMFCSYPRQLS